MESHEQGWFAHWQSLPYLFGLALVLLVFYWPAASLQGVFYVGDIYRLNYPLRAVYALEMQRGWIPLWAPEVLAGYPLLADGQTGAYYPPNLLLHRWLALPAALNYSVLASFWIAAAGLFLYVRSLGLRRGAAFLAACTFMLGGFLPAHLNHLNMVAAVAWLPLLLWAVERAVRRPRLQSWALVAALFGVQGLAGHPQVSFLSALLGAGQALAGPLAVPMAGHTLRQRLGHLGACCGALVAGAGLAMVQWAPTYELMRLSQRQGGLDYQFFTSFSLPPQELVALLWPFRRGNPYPAVSQETVGYVGALPLVLAGLALWRHRDRVAVFWAAVGGVAILMALGHFNPIYLVLRHVPLLNSFRVPARYLLWLDLAVAILAAVTANALLPATGEDLRSRRVWAPVTGLSLAALGGGFWISRVPLDRLLITWRWLPLVWLAATALLIVALRRRPPARLWLPLATGILLADLGAFVGVQNRTYNDVMPMAEFTRAPEALLFLQADAGPEPYRIYTDENWPGLPVMRESLYPNIALLHGVQSLNGYFPLVPTAQEWLLDNLNPRLLDLLNVRYVLVPQEAPETGQTGLFVTDDPFAHSLAGRSFALIGEQVAALEIEGFLIPAAQLSTGTPVAEITLRGIGGEQAVWTLRAGRELAPWAGLPEGQATEAGPASLEAVRIWPARFGESVGPPYGRTYRARYTLPQPLIADCIEVRALVPAASLRLERLRLIDRAGQARLLSALVGEGDHVLAYCSPGVAIYRNQTVGPRAWLVHRAVNVGSEDEAHRLLTSPSFAPEREVILLGGQELPGVPSAGDRVVVEAYERQYVRLRAATASPAYLVLADSFYPGWSARLDDRPVPVHRADVALRAVAVPAGEHVVEFSYSPLSWRLGQVVSAASALALVALTLWRPRRGA